MKMSFKKAEGGMKVLSSQVIATVSVALVLVMLGIIAIVGVGARNLARQMQDEVGFTVVMADSISPEAIAAFGKRLDAEAYTSSSRFVPAAEVLERWHSMVGDADSLLQGNPFLPEWEVRVNGQYTNPDSLAHIATLLRTLPEVEEVVPQTDYAESLHAATSTIEVLFTVIAVVLGIISFVLIINTVRLDVYARRLTINAMTLVGATRGFIRRPFVISALLMGIVAASVATVLLGGAMLYAATEWPWIEQTVLRTDAARVALGLYVAGGAICVLAAIIATNRYLRLDYDEMFS